ncbi:Protein cwh43, partial [Coemansia sp. RSA 2424]
AALSLVGIVAYATPSPARRLLGVVVGTAGALLGLGAALRPDGIGEAGRLARDIQAWEAGLLASVAVRMVFQTNNPVWATMNEANGGWNKTGIALGLLALADVATRRNSDKTIATKRSDKPREAQVLAPSWLPVGLGLGALLFALHSLYSDSAIVGRWSWDGYPATGPAPVPWGGLVLTALAGGFAGGHRLELATGMLWWAAGSAGACAITLVSGWSGFAGGLVLAAYVGSVTRSILLAAARCPPGRTLGAALLWYNVLVLAHVWVVAYEFVPGGPLLRERTWVVMLATMLSLYGGVRAARASLVEGRPAGGARKAAAGVLPVDAALLARRVRWAAVALGWGAMLLRLPAATRTPTPFHAPERLITAAIWTVHFDLDNDMWLAENRIIAAVRDLQAD